MLFAQNYSTKICPRAAGGMQGLLHPYVSITTQQNRLCTQTRDLFSVTNYLNRQILYLQPDQLFQQTTVLAPDKFLQHPHPLA